MNLALDERMGDSTGVVSAPATVGLRVREGCNRCGGELTPTYFCIAGSPVCRTCRLQIGGSWARAASYALVAGALSVGLYYWILNTFAIRFSLMPVVAGVLIGGAVSRGAGVDRLFGQRVFAIAVTYLASAGTYTHAVLGLPTVDTVMEAARQALVLPFATAIQGKNIVTLVLLLMGLHEAFRFAAPSRTNVQGPIGDRDPGATPEDS